MDVGRVLEGMRVAGQAARAVNGKPEGGIEQIELEMAYTPYHDACKDPALDPTDNGLRECRRQRGHKGPHASGFIRADSLMMWGNTA